jgi:branched-chain amino acid transport system substrate-binding protein
MRKHKVVLAAAATAGVAMLAAACSSSSGGGGTASSGSSEPIRIAFMSILSGPNYVKGAENGFTMAIDEINAAGGVNGRKLEWKGFDVDITVQGAVNATNLALQYKPDLFVGYGITAGLKASVPALNNLGVPVIHTTLASLGSPDQLGSQLTFRLSANTSQYAEASTKYLFDTKGVKSMLMANTETAAPVEGAKFVLEDATQAGVKTEHRSIAPTATDVTEPIIAAKSMNADAIWSWGFATTDALFIKGAAQNAYNGQIMTFSAGTAARAGLIPANLLTDKISQVAACAPLQSSTDQAKKYVAAYQTKFGTAVTDSVQSSLYDAVYIFKAAVEKAGSTDPAKVAAALAQTDYQGVCGPEKADQHHNLMHTVYILNFAGGTPQLAKQYDDLASPF